jgi:hypothetical protein
MQSMAPIRRRSLAALALFSSLAAAQVFPLKVSADHRHIVDARNSPWLMNADTAWLLFFRLTPEEADFYLKDRKQRGFTAVLTQLLSYRNDAKTTSGLHPLQDPNDITTLNPAFLDHLAATLASAQRHNLSVWIAPAWLSCCEGGWRDTMLKNGPEKNRRFGQIIGKRFAEFNNIVWILGGDRDPGSYRGVIDAMAEGIRSAAPNHLLTAHAGSPNSATPVYPNAKWLDINTTYTYSPEITTVGRPQFHVYAASKNDYQREPKRPFVLLESAYEGERNSTPQMIRRQAYWSILSGSSGHALGNLPIYPFQDGWRQALSGTGSQSMAVLHRFFAGIRWDRLVPDFDHRFLTAGFGTYETNPAKDANHRTGFDYVTAMSAPDGSILVAYLPTSAPVTIDPKLVRNWKRAWFVDPSDGRMVRPRKFEPTAKGITLEPPAKNLGGDSDWLLLIRGK